MRNRIITKRTDRTVAGPTTTTYEHVRDGLKVVGNIDATNTNTAPTWTNHPNALKPVESQQVQTNSAVQFINVSDEIAPARRTYNPSSSAAGDTSAIASKGRLVLVNGALPATQGQTTTYPSELFSQRNMTYNENSIALPSDRGTLELSGVNLMYEGTRVKSWLVGRDLNPAGRGDGSHYALGGFVLGDLRPASGQSPLAGEGNSINNPLLDPQRRIWHSMLEKYGPEKDYPCGCYTNAFVNWYARSNPSCTKSGYEITDLYHWYPVGWQCMEDAARGYCVLYRYGGDITYHRVSNASNTCDNLNPAEFKYVWTPGGYYDPIKHPQGIVECPKPGANYGEQLRNLGFDICGQYPTVIKVLNGFLRSNKFSEQVLALMTNLSWLCASGRGEIEIGCAHEDLGAEGAFFNKCDWKLHFNYKYFAGIMDGSNTIVWHEALHAITLSDAPRGSNDGPRNRLVKRIHEKLGSQGVCLTEKMGEDILGKIMETGKFPCYGMNVTWHPSKYCNILKGDQRFERYNPCMLFDESVSLPPCYEAFGQWFCPSCCPQYAVTPYPGVPLPITEPVPGLTIISGLTPPTGLTL